MTKKLSIILASFAMVGYIGCTDIPGFPVGPGGGTGNGGGGSTTDPTDSIPDRDPWGGGDTIIIGGDTLIIDDHGGRGEGGMDDCDSTMVGDTLIIDDHGGRRGPGRRGGPDGGRRGDDDGSDTLRTNG